MKLLLPFLLVLFSVANLQAQTGGKNSTEFSTPLNIAAKSQSVSSGLFGLSGEHELRWQYDQPAAGGRTHHKFQQYYKGLRVLGGTVVLHALNGVAHTATGLLHEFENLETKPKITAKAGEQLARINATGQLLNRPGKMEELTLTNATRVVTNADFPAAGGAYTLAYVFTLEAENDVLPVSVDVIVDARNGHIIASLDNIHTQSATGHGNGYYHQDITFPVTQNAAGQFELRDETRGLGVIARNISYHYLTPTDDDNEWNYPEEGQSAMLDGYLASVKFHDFLSERFNRNSIDNAGHQLVANMNRHAYVNAFWNRTESTYGNGDCEDYSALTNFEIVGHEFAHGLTQFTSGLIYFNESGALNESISDIMGKAFEYYYDREHFNWKIGQHIVKGPGGTFFRSMESPNRRSHPSFYKGNFWRYDLSDNAGVHSKSGVFNFWFYLLVEGKRGVNQASTRYDVAPIGMDSALQLVYLLETAYLTESSGYLEAFTYSKLAAAELFGADSPPYASMIEAWKAVGITDATEPDEEEEKTLSLSVDYEGGNPVDFAFCPAELENFTSRFTLTSDTIIQQGSLLTGQMIFSYNLAGEAINDTLPVEWQVFMDDLTNQNTFTVPTSYVPADGVSYLTITNQLSITTPDSVEIFTTDFVSYLSVNTTQTVNLSFQQLTFSEPCSQTPSITEEFLSFSLPRCAGPAAGTIRFTYTGPDNEVIYERSLLGNESPRTIFFDINRQVDLASLGDLNDVTLSVSYLEDGAATLLYENRFDQYFAESFDGSAIEDFSDETSARKALAIQLCPTCKADYSTEALVITDEANFYNPEECIPVTELMNVSVNSKNQRLSTISLCVDASGIDNPYLAFDLTQRDTSRHTARQNEYQHITDVYAAGVSLLPAAISTTGDALKAVEVKLGNGFTGEVQLHVVSSQVKTIIDNLRIVSGSPSSTGLPGQASLQFTFPNPVNGQLALRSAQPVPQGTQVQLFSANGQLLLTSPMQGDRLSLPTESLPAGLYFLSVSDGNTFRWTSKAIKQ